MRRALLGLVLLLGCARETPTRGQTVLYLDTNVSVPQLGDALLIERLDGAGNVIDARRHIAPSAADWPVSFGVLPGGTVRFRVRLFPETRIASSKRDDSPVVVAPGEVDAARADYDRDASYALANVGDPLPGFTIDRLIEVTPPSSGVAHVRVTLRGECMGVASDRKTSTTCIGGDATSPKIGRSNEGLEAIGQALVAGDTQVGTWSEAREQPCEIDPRAESGIHDEERCIPGGVFFLGDERMGSALCLPLCTTVPERVVRMSPFLIDKYEVSVGRFRAAKKAGFVPKPGTVSTGSLCAYREDGKNDLAPMNCVTWQAGADFCAFDGGRFLTSEAQWEYAASGRGNETLYVWGDSTPSCERAAFARVGEKINPAYGGPPTIGSFTECKLLSQGWAIGGSFSEPGQDVTRDGVLDMNGNLREWMRDEIETYDRGCWAKPLLRDPVCLGLYPEIHAARGASWGGGTGQLSLAWRDGIVPVKAIEQAPFLGFRCARPAK